MTKITSAQLLQILSEIKGNTFISFESFTKPAQRKTDNPYDEILKLSEVNASTGFNYEANVQRQQIREGLEADFKAQERKWGRNVNNVVVEKETKDGMKYYIRCRVLKTLKDPVYYGRKGNILTEVKKEDIKPWLQETHRAMSQNTEVEIVYRDYMFSSIRTLRINGNNFEILV